MLLEFRVGNFLSFKEVQTLRMRRKDKDGKESGSDHAFIFGPNAAGKSNFIKALDYSRSYILSYGPQKILEDKSYRNLKDEHSAKELTYFEYIIRLDGKDYSYGFEINYLSPRIESEWLIRLNDNKTIFDYNYSKMDFEALLNILPENKFYSRHIGGKIVNLNPRQPAYSIHAPGTGVLLRNNKVQVPLLRYFSDIECQNILNWFENNMIVVTSTGYSECTPVPNDYIEIMTKELIRLDTGIKGIELIPFKNKEIPLNLTRKMNLTKSDTNVIYIQGNKRKKRYWFILSIKKGSGIEFYEMRFDHGADYKARIEEESTGTIKIIQLLTLLFSQNNGKKDTIVIDELECSINTLVMIEIIRLYSQLAGEGTQLIATTHENRIMSMKEMNVDSIWFVDSHRKGVERTSEIYSLHSYKDSKSNIREQYMDGRFAAVPSFFEYDIGDE